MKQELFADVFLKTGCVQINVNNPFKYASGLKGPVYFDCRRILSFPRERKVLLEGLMEQNKDISFDGILAMATGGIAFASFLSWELDLPMCYFRSKPKDHGHSHSVEGNMESMKRIIIVEDLINQGSSVKKALKYLKDNYPSIHVLRAISLINYESKAAKEVSKEFACEFRSLCGLNELISLAKDKDIINQEEKSAVLRWINAL